VSWVGSSRREHIQTFCRHFIQQKQQQDGQFLGQPAEDVTDHDNNLLECFSSMVFSLGRHPNKEMNHFGGHSVYSRPENKTIISGSPFRVSPRQNPNKIA
jgi:hypothetical protein